MANKPLFKHQVESVQRLQGLDRALDASDPGTGKTRVEVEDYAAALRRGARCALVIAPRSILDCAWYDDFRQYAPHIKVSVAYAKNREEAFRKDADVYVTNTDATKWLAQQSKYFFARFDRLIVDEISMFKHHTSLRSKALAKIRHYFQTRRGMSGSPNANHITDIWHQAYVLDDGQRLGTSFYKFRHDTCYAEQVGPQPNMLKWLAREGAEGVIADLMADMTIRHKFEDCIDIPPNHEYQVRFRLPHKARRAYEDMRKHSLALIERFNELNVRAKLLGEPLEHAEITAINAAAMVTKLLQIASGAVYDENGAYALVERDRYELIADLVEARPHSVVFFMWKHQKAELVAELARRNLTYAVVDSTTTDAQRADIVRFFQQGFYRTVLCHPQSAAHGLTLTKANTTIWASPTYNLEHKLQGDRRIYRAGQTQKTETINVIAEDTIEEQVMAKLAAKNMSQAAMLELLLSLSNPLRKAA